MMNFNLIIARQMRLSQQFLSFMIASIVLLFLFYALVAYIRRKIVKPNYINKTVWITGASSGIGEYLAYQFNLHGAYVILSARNVKELERVKNSCPHPQNAEIVPLDMANFQHLRTKTQEVIDQLQTKGKRIDVMVENAGISMRSDFVDYSFENHKALFDVNIHGPFNHMQIVVPHMIKHKGGQIVGVSSQNGKLATAYRASYCSSKHALIGLLDSIRSELKPHNIRVCNVMPGFIKTSLAKNALIGAPGQKFGKTDMNIYSGMCPQKFAKEAVGAIYNNQNEVSISQDWSPIFGITMRNLCPDLVFSLLFRHAKVQHQAVENAKDE